MGKIHLLNQKDNRIESQSITYNLIVYYLQKMAE